MTPGADRITGQISDGHWNAVLWADRAIFNAQTNPAPFTGKYTMIIPGTLDDPTVPGGDGCGAVNVDRAGAVALVGTLADGTAITQRAPLSKDGQWPLYIPLYAGKGSILSWVTFTNASSGVGGRLNWNKPAMAASKYYRNGFDVESMLTGSRYIPPLGATNRILSFSNGVVVCSGGNLSQPVTNAVSIGTNNKVTNLGPARLVFTMMPATGLFSGIVVDPTTGKAIPFKGALLQGLDFGAGHFLRTNQSGQVSLRPAE
jgi:hypothetical protein